MKEEIKKLVESGAEVRDLLSITEASKEKEFEVEYWIYVNDDYDIEYVKVKAKDEKEALKKAEKEAPRRAKKFKIHKG